jgi:hypothetical protein
MQLATVIAIGLAPLATWLIRKALKPVVRDVESLPEGKLRRLLLWGDDRRNGGKERE